MKKIELFIITMLFVISYAYADGYRTDEDHWEKVRQMDEMAERFKAETGFMGEINPDSPLKHLTGFRGKFPDIPFSANADSVTFRQACERIVDRILPYTSANRSQLSMSRISKSVFGYTTEYYQQVGGYRVESRGLILITFDEGMNRFSISNGTVELPDENVGTIISEEEAERKALKDKDDTHYTKARVKNTFYTNMGSNMYYLAHLVCVSDDSNPFFGDYTYYINAISGKVMLKHPATFINYDVSVRALGNDYIESSAWNVPPNYHTIEPLNNVEVNLSSSTIQTNNDGYANFTNVTDSIKTLKLSNPLFKVSALIDTLNAVKSIIDSIDSSHQYSVLIPDSVYFAPNTYIEANNHISNLMRLYNNQNYFHHYLNIVTFATPPDYAEQTFGGYSPDYYFIWLRDGRLSDIVRHELSHNFIHNVLGVRSFDAPATTHTNTGAMDEACANYLAGSPTNNSILPQLGHNLDMASVISLDENATLNEGHYSKYENSLSIASAWWALRSDLHFGSTAVDTLLIAGLGIVKTGIVEGTNNTYRYKPRYFYNILMSRVDTDNKSWPFNPKQAAIDNMYSDRGFHFYPKVQSVASADVTTPLGRESYNVLDSVYVHISNYPQNTYVQVFVVEDRDYLNVGDNGIAIPAPYEVDGNPVSGIFKTDGNGKWAGGIPFSRLLPQGDYDIIVNNMVNPTAPNNNPTDPDNTLHLAFKNDYIIDGVDGLDGPGFTKTGTGDIVVALDFSSSMSGYGAQLAQMVKVQRRQARSIKLS